MTVRSTRCAALALLAALPSAGCLDLPDPAAPTRSLALAPSAAAMTLGDTVRLHPVVVGGGGGDASDRWSSDDPGVALVSATGLVTAVGVGSTTVLVERDGRTAEAAITVIARFTFVSAGTFHSCALTARERIACWGRNRWGELGGGTLLASPTPTLATGERFTSVGAGGFTTCAMNVTGASCWGANWSAQLGAGTADTLIHATPQEVDGGMLRAVSVGLRHVCGLDPTTGEAWCWGGGAWGELGAGIPDVFCLPSGEPCALAPAPVTGALAFSEISAGANHTCGLTGHGAGYCWGRNVAGELGDGSTVPRAVPTAVAGELRFAALDAGTGHTCAVASDGRAYCWGSNGQGQLGTGAFAPTTVPTLVATDVRFASVTVGGHSCALTVDGQAYCWGANGAWQLGTANGNASAVPVPVDGLRFVQLSAGQDHTCGLATDGFVYCWGFNAFGQLGTGSPVLRALPAPVAGQR